MRTSRSAALPAAVAWLCLAACLVAGCGAAAPGPPRPAGTTPALHVRARPTAAALPRSVPERLTIAAIGVDTPLVQLGLRSDGTVQVPPVAAHSPAGWYRGSPTPGQPGPAVVLGHVTVGRYGDGVFLRLSRLRSGDRVTVSLADGDSAAFTVYAVRTVAKDRFPTRAVYGDTARPELRLITCGGPRTADGYRDNVVVFAALDPGAV
jgi:hypothetical protein